MTESKIVFCPECRTRARVIEYVTDTGDPKWTCTCVNCDNLFYLFDTEPTPLEISDLGGHNPRED